MLARLALVGLLVPLSAAAQSEKPKVFYFPKPVARTHYQPPMKPVTRLADLKAKHQGEANWRELVIDDGNTKASMVQEAPGTRHARRLYPDSPAWWAVLAGRIRYEIEKPEGGFEIVEARKGSYVFVPERMVHSFEVVGDEPAIRFEVTLYEATPVFQEKPADSSGVEYIPVTLSTGMNPLDVPDPDGKPWPSHVNIYDLEKENAGRPRWTVPAMRKNRARGNFICGQASAEPALKPGNRGHFHADFAETWVVMLGKLRWIFEGDVENAVIAEQGDIVYAPPKTFHLPQFYGEEGLNCRLTNSTFPSANHLYDAEE